MNFEKYGTGEIKIISPYKGLIYFLNKFLNTL